jgi:hypothetical protein
VADGPLFNAKVVGRDLRAARAWRHPSSAAIHLELGGNDGARHGGSNSY